MRSRFFTYVVTLLLASGLAVTGTSSISPTAKIHTYSWPLCC